MAFNDNGFNKFPRSSAAKNSNTRAQNTNQNEANVGITLVNERAGKFLGFNYWGRYANIEIGTVQPGVPLTWEVRRNSQKTMQNLTFSDLNDLWDACEEVMESLKNTGTFTSTAIRVGTNSDSMLEINNGKSISHGPGIYLVVYKGLDVGNRSNNPEIYPFDEVKFYKDYDCTSGSAKEEISKTGQFKKFYRTVKEAAKAFTMAQAHTIAAIKRNDKLTTFKALSVIAAKMGVDMSAELDTMKNHSPGTGAGSYGYRKNNPSYNNQRYTPPRSGGSYGSYPQKQPQQSPPVQMTTSIDDPIDISLSMNDISNVDISQFK